MSWPRVKLSDVATINPRPPREVDESQQVTFVAMASASEDGHLLASETRVLSETKKGFTYFDRNDVLLAKITPCFENGKCLRPGQIPTEIGFGSTEFHVIRPDGERLDGLYLFYLVWNEQFRFLGEKSMSGAAGQKRVGSDFLKGFEIPLPPLPEQKRIAAILDKADAIRRKRQQAIQLADDFLRAVFLDMFGDPVTNSKGWEVRALSNLIDESRGVSYGVVQRGEQADEGIPLVRISDIATNEFRPEDVVKCSKSISDQYRRTILHGGELLISIRGTVGRVAEVPSMAAGWNISREVAVIPILSGVSSSFLKWLLLSSPIQRSLAGQIKGVAQSGINLVDLRKLPVICPPAAVIEDFEFAERKIREKYILCAEKINGNELFSSLSQKAFAGLL